MMYFYAGGWQVTENEKKYSEYVKDVSNVRTDMLSLLSGFTFSAIIILLNQLPDPNSLMSQFALLFLTVIFDLLLFLLGWQTIITIGLYNVPNPPPRAKWELTAFNVVLYTVFILWGYSLVVIFILWNLISLTLVSGIMWTLAIIVAGFASQSMSRRLGWSLSQEIKKTIKGRD
jgi:hypothetical protein